MREKYAAMATDLCRKLIRCPSVSGMEKEAADCLVQAMEELEFDQVETDRYGNVLGTIVGREPGPCILFDGHIDTVPVPDETAWSVPPFGGAVRDGKIYGRGASDMKGALAAMTAAAAWFAEKTSRNFKGKICIAGVVHEECFEGIASREITARINPDYVVIGEASELNLKIGQRGRAEIVVETFGKPAHSANPEQGVNAVHLMTRLIDRIEQVQPLEQPILGKGICVLTDIKSTPYPGASVVPSNCRVTYDRRLLVGEDPASVLTPFEQAIHQLAASDPDFKAKVHFARGTEACYTGALLNM